MGQIILVKAIKDTVTENTTKIYCTAWDYDWEILNHRYKGTKSNCLYP